MVNFEFFPKNFMAGEKKTKAAKNDQNILDRVFLDLNIFAMSLPMRR